MPTPAYMTVSGSNQGAMNSGATGADSIGTMSKASQEDTIQIQAFEHNITVPKDPQSGQPTGQRVHQGFTVTKVYDKSSPMLYQALATGEQIKKATIKWYRTAPTGEQEHYFTTEVEDALITNIRAHMPNCLKSENASMSHMEDVSFSYKKINWTHEKAGTSGSDSWDN